MSRYKHIEEMAREICSEYDCIIPCQSCAYYGYANCRDVKSAEKLYNAGYRKTADVAEEIFAEIEELLNLQAKIVCETRGKYSETDKPMLSFIATLDGRLYSLRVIEEHIAELKKKYTVTDTNVGCKDTEEGK